MTTDTTEGAETPAEIPPTPTGPPTFKVHVTRLEEALKTAVVFTQHQDRQLGGVHLCGGPNLLKVSATNQAILSVETLGVDGTPFPFTLSSEDCRLLMPLMERFTGSVEVTSIPDRGKVAFRLGDPEHETVTFEAYALKVGGFPDLDDILARYPEGEFSQTALSPHLLAAVTEAVQDRHSLDPLEVVHQTYEMWVARQGPLTVAVKPMRPFNSPTTSIAQPRPCHPEGTQP